MIRIGILGAAKIGPQAIIDPAAARSDCEVVAVAARDETKARTYADTHGIAHVETDYEALVRRADVDLIYNALPPHRHADLTIAALEVGKAVLCEKPFAMNTAEATRMVDAAHRTGKPLIEAFHYRFHPAFLRVLEIVRSGELGAIKTMDAVFNVSIPYREGELRHTLNLGGGALMDLGCYSIHMIRTLADAEPDVLSASAHCDRPGVDISTKAHLGFSSGASANVECSMADGERKIWLEVVCTDGCVSLLNPVHPHRGHEITIRQGGDVRTETAEGNVTYEHQLDHVMDVLSGRVLPLTGGADAIGNMAPIDAIYEAAGLSPRGDLPPA